MSNANTNANPIASACSCSCACAAPSIVAVLSMHKNWSKRNLTFPSFDGTFEQLFSKEIKKEGHIELWSYTCAKSPHPSSRERVVHRWLIPMLVVARRKVWIPCRSTHTRKWSAGWLAGWFCHGSMQGFWIDIEIKKHLTERQYHGSLGFRCCQGFGTLRSCVVISCLHRNLLYETIVQSRASMPVELTTSSQMWWCERWGEGWKGKGWLHRILERPVESWHR